MDYQVVTGIWSRIVAAFWLLWRVWRWKRHYHPNGFWNKELEVSTAYVQQYVPSPTCLPPTFGLASSVLLWPRDGTSSCPTAALIRLGVSTKMTVWPWHGCSLRSLPSVPSVLCSMLVVSASVMSPVCYSCKTLNQSMIRFVFTPFPNCTPVAGQCYNYLSIRI